PRPLPRVRLFLDKPYPQNLLLNIRQERVHNLRLFDPQSLGEYLFHRYDLSLLDLSAELCLWNPSDFLTGTLAHLAASNGADETAFLTCSKCPDKSSGFSPRLRYAAGMFPSAPFQPRLGSSLEEAEALTISPLIVASVICTVTYWLVSLTTARGLPDFTSALRSL